MRKKSFTYSLPYPKNEEPPPLDKRLEKIRAKFTQRFGEEPRFIMMRPAMAEGWSSDKVLGMTIIKNKHTPKNYYMLAVAKELFYAPVNPNFVGDKDETEV